MNKFLAICFTIMLCMAVAMAAYPRARYHSYGGHKLSGHHLGGAAYGYHQPKYTAHGLSYKKPVAVHYAQPIVYAHRSYSKPKVTHYIKPSHGHEVYHAPVYRSKPVYYLGGHASHGAAYKPAVHHAPAVVHHAPTYVHKSHH